MQKIVRLGAVAALAISCSGCIVVAKTRGPLMGPCCGRQAVAVDGGLYVVDVCSGEVSKIEPKAVSEAGPFTVIEHCGTHDIIIDDD